jgi:transcriptional regulator with PAS, ATPase and Fis domain
MIKIALVVDEPGLFETAFSTFEEHNKYEYSQEPHDVYSYTLEEVVCSGKALCKLQIEADVAIARGVSAEILKSRKGFIPVVEIPVAGYDMINILHESRKFGKKKVAVIGSKNMLYGVTKLAGVLDLEILPFVIKQYVDGPKSVNEAIKQGCEVVICGRKTAAYAKKKGISNLFIKTGTEALWQAFTEAKRVAHVRRTEHAKAEQFKTILHFAYEGIIGIDENKKITVLNDRARKILNIDVYNISGKRIDEILLQCELRKILLSGEHCLNKVIRYQNMQLVVTNVPIMLKEMRLGNVATFQDVTGMQQSPDKIQKVINFRGHSAKYTFDHILGSSTKIKETISIAKQYGKANSTVLIVGETGTGKELFAHSIHNDSLRWKGPFVAINCSALPDDLLESELFGYVGGAFTGAVKGGKPGLFELANRGTIFLDEIFDISNKLQSRLLRVLQEREIMRIGDDKVLPIDVRVIAATNKDLGMLVEKGVFRNDLYYRLDVLTLEIPNLNDRREDIPIIANAFFEHFKLEFGYKNMTLTEKAEKILREFNWRGNIRQLRNVCEKLAVLFGGKTIIDSLSVERVLSFQSNMAQSKEIMAYAIPDSYPAKRENYEKQQIIEALKQAKYNTQEAAKKLNISKTTLWRRMKKFKLQ